MTLVSHHKSPLTQNILFLKPLTDTPLHTLTKKKRKEKNMKFCLIKHINKRKSSMSGVSYFNQCTKFGLSVDLSCTCNETASRLHDALARAVCRQSERSARLQMSLMGVCFDVSRRNLSRIVYIYIYSAEVYAAFQSRAPGRTVCVLFTFCFCVCYHAR